QSAEGPRSQTLSRRARRRFAAPHVEQRACRKGAERHSCPRFGRSDTGTAPARALARYAGSASQRCHQGQEKYKENRKEEKVIACRRSCSSVRRKSRNDAVGTLVCR